MPRSLLAPLAPLAFAACLAAGSARASGPLAPQHEAITTSDYALDLFTGPVLSSARVTGMGGAYAGIAEGVDGNVVNAAAPALRQPWSYDWFDYDLSVGLTLPGLLASTDFDNNGIAGFEYQDFYFLSGALNLQLGQTAVGLTADLRTFNLGQVAADPSAPTKVSAALGGFHVLLARGFWDGQLVFGIGFRYALFSLDASPPGVFTQASNVFLADGTGWETGLLVAPTGSRLRAGVSARMAVEGTPKLTPDESGDYLVRGFYVPKRVILPWEIEAGFALELGSRPLNPGWLNPRDYTAPLREEQKARRAARERQGLGRDQRLAAEAADANELEAEREDLRARRRHVYEAMPRMRFLISASVLVSGSVDDAVGTESFFRRTVDRSGEKVCVTPRLGIETEPVPGWLQIRVGAYYEPSRYRDATYRVHGTAGVDLKVLPWTVFGIYPDGTWWSVGAVGDFSARYMSVSFRLGVWR